MKELNVDEIYIDTAGGKNINTPTGKFILTIFGAVAELEYILQRQREGIAIAKQYGKYTGRKLIELLDYGKVVSKWRNGKITSVKAMELLHLSNSAFYRRVEER